MSSLGPLQDNGKVIIIGGGPAGAACALALHRLAAHMAKRVQVTVLEGKQFSGEGHFNQCTGVLSPPLPQVMEDRLGLPFPSHLARSKIVGYYLTASGQQSFLRDEAEPSIAVRRIHFDAYMLEAVKQQGVRVLTARAVDLEFHPSSVVVYTDKEQLEAHVVVGAFGLDEGSTAMFSRLTPYRPPRSLSAVVTKYHPGPEAMRAFGGNIHAFLPSDPRIEFGAITPKGNHLTINIAGRSVDAPLMQHFLDLPEVHQQLLNFEAAGELDPHDLRFFKGRFPRSLARRYYGDHYVMVGDAAGLVRSFKGKGITSAVQSGIHAAETILTAGISEGAFHDHYEPANRDLTRDLPYGQAVRLVTIGLARIGLLRPVLRAAAVEPNLRKALFGAVSAHSLYREVLRDALSVRSLAAILRSLVPLRGQDHPPIPDPSMPGKIDLGK